MGREDADVDDDIDDTNDDRFCNWLVMSCRRNGDVGGRSG